MINLKFQALIWLQALYQRDCDMFGPVSKEGWIFAQVVYANRGADEIAFII